jgi:hypothetical protein
VESDVMAYTYNYTRSGVCPDDLTRDINDSGNYSYTCLYVVVEDDINVKVVFENQLPPDEEAILNTQVANFVCNNPPADDSTLPGQVDEQIGIFTSYAEMVVTFGDKYTQKRDWIRLGYNKHTYAGFVFPENGVITKITGHTTYAKGSGNKNIDLYINDTVYPGVLTFTADDQEEKVWNNNLNIQFSQGDKLRLRVNMPSSAKLYTVTFGVWFKWRQ